MNHSAASSRTRHPARRLMTVVSGVAILATSVFTMTLLASCTGSGSPDSGSSGSQSSDTGVSVGEGGPDELFAETASFETVANVKGRYLVGVSTQDQRILAGGKADLTFIPVNGGDALSAEATYLSLPGMPPVTAEARLGRPSAGTGVFATEITLPSPGIWEVQVKPQGSLAGKTAKTAIEVLAKGQVPQVGEPAPRTANLTLASPGVQQQWLDSLASADAPADPLLHSTVIADAIAQHKALVIVVSTPAYCVSRFCGPITEVVRARAERDKSRSDISYVHLEVWKDFAKTVVNKGAAEWMLTNGAEGREPWVFVVDKRGIVTARFDNVLSEETLDAAIAAASK